MIRKGFLLFSTLILLIAVAACGGNGAPGSSPAGPSATPLATVPATSGASIDGVVSGLAGTSAAGMVGARGVTTVTATVGDVTITATIDGQGKFVISGLPAGSVTLTFSGTNATVTLQNVGPTEKIKIVVTIAGGAATVETQERALDGKVELEGRISALAAPSFLVGQTEVALAPGAAVRHGETDIPAASLFTTLKVGDRVHVRGVPGTPTVVGATAAITAELVIVQNTNAKVPVNLKGTVGTTSGACPAVTFLLEGWTVQTVEGMTDYKKGLCPDLTTGAAVHVKGDVVDGKVRATSIQFEK
ncbi:MAG TPA: DUF5666 domain-containing protein [Vicinamibacterales bacterium]|nr:DUF5666 domain-containing protein [Vicinamibacterales bacterium]